MKSGRHRAWIVKTAYREVDGVGLEIDPYGNLRATVGAEPALTEPR